MADESQDQLTIQIIPPFNGKNIPVRVDGESLEGYNARLIAFWRDYPLQAPAWIKAELAEEHDSGFDSVLIGRAAVNRESCFADLCNTVLNDTCARFQMETLAGEKLRERDNDGNPVIFQPSPLYKIVLKAALEHQSKMQIERLKTRGTMRVERQRFGNELEILKAAQGAISVNDRITIELSPMKSAGGKRAQKALEANNRAAVAKQDENSPDALFDDIAAAPPPEIDRNIPEDTE